jgi:hypothetical protein
MVFICSLWHNLQLAKCSQTLVEVRAEPFWHVLSFPISIYDCWNTTIRNTWLSLLSLTSMMKDEESMHVSKVVQVCRCSYIYISLWYFTHIDPISLRCVYCKLIGLSSIMTDGCMYYINDITVGLSSTYMTTSSLVCSSSSLLVCKVFKFYSTVKASNSF